MNWKNVIGLLIVGLIFSCSSDDDKDKTDPVTQALIDDELLIEYLQSHYLTEDKAIDTIMNGEQSLYEIVEVDVVKYNDIDYKMYYYVDEQGIGKQATINDSVQILYKGFLLDSTRFDQNITYTSTKSWFHLPNTIPGFRHGAKHFKEGEVKVNPDESFEYVNAGNGVFFMPSGLAYGSSGSFGIPENAILYYFFELGKVVEPDADNDGILNKDEDIDGDGDVIGDDTDGDGVFNFLDVDDDNDRILTKDEDTNGDGDPTNDDDDNDGIPNYLDSDS